MSNLSIANWIILIGIGCVVVAIVGSGVKFYRVEVDAISSLRRQILLAVFGFVLIVAGSIEPFRSMLNGTKDGGEVAQTPDRNGAAASTAPDRTEAVQSRIAITSPVRGQSVAPREFVRGRASRDMQQILLIVHPREVEDCWAQGPGTVNADGTWQILGSFGEAGRRDAGKPYGVRAIASPRSPSDRPLEAGPVDCTLDAQRHTEWIDVVRM